MCQVIIISALLILIHVILIVALRKVLLFSPFIDDETWTQAKKGGKDSLCSALKQGARLGELHTHFVVGASNNP